MKPIFVIHNRNIPQMLTEYYSYATSGVRYGIYGIFAAILLITGLLGILPRVAGDILFYAVCAIVASWFTPHLIVWLAMRTVKKENGGGIPEALVTVEEDAIRVHEEMSTIVMEYHRIRKVKQLKHCFAVNAGTVVVLLEIRGFSEGSLEEFKNFLQSKRPDLKIPK